MKFKLKDRQNQPKKVKPRRIYLTEPTDYFGVKYVLKMQERQRQLAKEGLTGPLVDYPYWYPAEACKPVNGIVPSKYWRAYDLHNKPRSLYSEEEKRIAALEASFYRRTAISVPLKEVLTNKFKSYFSRLTGKRMESEPLMATTSNSPAEAQNKACSDTSSETSSISLSIDSTCLNRPRTRTISNNNNSRCPDQKCDGDPLKKHVHFAPQTVFCERDDQSRFWRPLTAKRRGKAARKAEKEESLRPRPFLPFLESGLSYCDDEEFYRLKNSNAHRYPQAALAQMNNRRRGGQGQGSICQAVTRAFRYLCCCFVPAREGHRSQSEDYYDWSARKSGSRKPKAAASSYRTRKVFHEKYL